MRNKRSGFGGTPNIYRSRSAFNLSHRVTTTFPVGKLVPIECVEVLPGETRRQALTSLTRLTSTFIRPVMDNIYLDTYTFFIPLRLVQENLEQVFGDSAPTAYEAQDLAQLAHVTTVQGETVTAGTIADYLGITPGFVPFGCRVAEMRAFAITWNNWFRNQNVDPETYVNLSDTLSAAETFNNNAWSATNYFGKLPPVTRYKDYFSTALPKPQKGSPQVMFAPVHAQAFSEYDIMDVPPQFIEFQMEDVTQNPVTIKATRQGGSGAHSYVGVGDTDSIYGLPYRFDLRNAYAGIDMTQLRLNMQLQKYLERDAIYGSRYKEYLRAAYGVESPDQRLQVPEFICGTHNRLNVTQVPATTTSTDYDLAQVAGMSQTLSDKSGRFAKSFTEHGLLLTVGCIRYQHTYSQGIPRQFGRIVREHFYDPLFDHLAQQTVYLSEIYAPGADAMRSDTGNPTDLLGYQEPFAEMRTIPNRTSGQARPTVGSLGAFWTLSDAYSGDPSLIDLVHEDVTSFNRVISDTTDDPFLIDFAFDVEAYRPISAYGMPGLIDHG